MSEKTALIRIPELHANQERIRRERARFNVIDCGRRFGKNVLLHDFAVEAAVDMQGPVGWAAPIYKQTLDDFRELDNILAPIISRRSASELRLELVTGGAIEFWSLEKPDSIRGKRYKRFIVNEAGLVVRLLDIFNYIISPTLIDYRGDFYAAGTPKGRNGFWTLHNQTGDDWRRWQMSSYCNPHIPADELDRLRHTMTERAFQQEIMAQFLEDGGGVFRNVIAAATAEPRTYAEQNHSYTIGVDWGRSDDATVFTVIDNEARSVVHLDRMSGTDYESQRLRLIALARRFEMPQIIAEYNSMGGPMVERLQSDGLSIRPFTTTNASKAQAIQSLEMAFEQGTIKIINDDTLVGELMAYESERLPSGLIRYGAPSGAHDDTVMSLALAWYGADYQGWFVS